MSYPMATPVKFPLTVTYIVCEVEDFKGPVVKDIEYFMGSVGNVKVDFGFN